MPIETIMIFALGFLAACLLALIIMPAIWRRAVRLTKARIEAATPMSMNEFRADKDQLRAEFAMSTRRLERNVETLRERLAGQISDIGNKKSELAKLKFERDQQLRIASELEARETELRARIHELERTGTDLAQRLRMRDRDYAELETQLEAESELASKLPEMDRLVAELTAERERARFFEDQAQSAMARLERAESDSAEVAGALADLRAAMARQDDDTGASIEALTEAETRIASAESKLNALLHETTTATPPKPGSQARLLAEKLSLEDELAKLREHIGDVENAVMQDWETERLDQSHLREKLNDIASEVSRLVYAVDGDPVPDMDESLFDRVKKYAGDGLAAGDVATAPSPAKGAVRRGSLTDRMMALRDIQARQ